MTLEKKANRVMILMKKRQDIDAELESILSGDRGTKRMPGPQRVSQARVLQGKFLGMTRWLPRAEKSRLKAVRKEKGIVEAVRLAEEINGERRQAEVDH